MIAVAVNAQLIIFRLHPQADYAFFGLWWWRPRPRPKEEIVVDGIVFSGDIFDSLVNIFEYG